MKREKLIKILLILAILFSIISLIFAFGSDIMGIDSDSDEDGDSSEENSGQVTFKVLPNNYSEGEENGEGE